MGRALGRFDILKLIAVLEVEASRDPGMRDAHFEIASFWISENLAQRIA